MCVCVCVGEWLKGDRFFIFDEMALNGCFCMGVLAIGLFFVCCPDSKEWWLLTLWLSCRSLPPLPRKKLSSLLVLYYQPLDTSPSSSALSMSPFRSCGGELLDRGGDILVQQPRYHRSKIGVCGYLYFVHISQW